MLYKINKSKDCSPKSNRKTKNFCTISHSNPIVAEQIFWTFYEDAYLGIKVGQEERLRCMPTASNELFTPICRKIYLRTTREHQEPERGTPSTLADDRNPRYSSSAKWCYSKASAYRYPFLHERHHPVCENSFTSSYNLKTARKSKRQT